MADHDVLGYQVFVSDPISLNVPGHIPTAEGGLAEIAAHSGALVLVDLGLPRSIVWDLGVARPGEDNGVRKAEERWFTTNR